VSERLGKIARTCGLALAVGLPELDPTNGQRHNTLLLLDACGREQFRYRKVHLWDSEKAWAQAGTEFPVRPFGGLRIGATVCYDVRFPEGARSLALAGAEIILLAAAWLGPVDEWELAVRSRALDNGVFVVASAMQGEPYLGSSLIVDPHGAVLARGEPETEAVLVAHLDPDLVRRFRDEVPLLRDRRPESYSS
jgi:predicted amidohydrolase